MTSLLSNSQIGKALIENKTEILTSEDIEILFLIIQLHLNTI